ncbi:Clavaminate synthase-like protein [Vararia minispora EC-137]|uniref:Clavaminate synthase-like protein n=1 Tax=Vararia minispora EC-137 TaxID=1314806 RepID=A0ACB8QHZ8_9AGAM|nr:Clavaminate synthase-like protein [Vararia minispora EC-137]
MSPTTDHAAASFPDNLPTVPLFIINYELIKAHDESETERLFIAAKEIGFWYLKNHGVEDDTEDMFVMGEETMALPYDEKMRFEQGDSGCSFGYKCAGAVATDEDGTPDSIESINISRDDALAWPQIVHRTYPTAVNNRMESTIMPFIRKSIEINNVLLEALERKLELPRGILASKHSAEEHTSSEVRAIKAPKNQHLSNIKVSLDAHSDYGTITFLHNRVIGGLQVLLPGTDEWMWVKPIPGHAICNLGDAMVIFSGGILRSNMHRVVPPPVEQAAHDRWSLAYFTRPGDSVVLEALSSDSPMIAEAAAKKIGAFDTSVTAADWFARRIRNRRLANRKGPETWWASRGTEHSGNPIVAY